MTGLFLLWLGLTVGAQAGTYDVEITHANGTTATLPGLDVRENLTYVRTFPAAR